MGTDDIVRILQTTVAIILPLIAIGGIIWKIGLGRMWRNLSGSFDRLSSVEDKQGKHKEANETSFKELRIALDNWTIELDSTIKTGNAETIKRLDHINGSVAELQKSDIAQNLQIAVNEAKRAASIEVLKALGRASRQGIIHHEDEADETIELEKQS